MWIFSLKIFLWFGPLINKVHFIILLLLFYSIILKFKYQILKNQLLGTLVTFDLFACPHKAPSD